MVPYLVRNSRDEVISNKLGANMTSLDVYRKAKACLLSLSQLLEDKTFLFSNEKYAWPCRVNFVRPTSADAIAFACISCLLYPKMVDEEMGKSLLSAHPALVKYADNIADKYFRDTSVKSASVGEYSNIEHSLRKKDAEQVVQKRNDWLYIGGTAAALGICYFLHNYTGIINIASTRLAKLNLVESIDIKF